MTAKQAALEQIAALTTAHGITVEEIRAYLAGQTRPETQRGGAARLLAYVGGAFVFSGVALLISFIWDDIGSAQRVILTFATGVAALVMGVACVCDSRFVRAAAPLFLISAFLQPFGLFVFLDEYLPQTGRPELAAMVVFGTLAAQHGLVFSALRRSSLLFLCLVFVTATLAALADLVELDAEVTAVAIGVIVLALAWTIARTPHVAITPFWYFVGGSGLTAGWWSLWEGSALDVSTLGLSVALVALSIAAASRTLLFVGVAGLLSYLSYFAYEYFADVIGWPITLIVLGLLIMGAGGWAMKLGRRLRDRPVPNEMSR